MSQSDPGHQDTCSGASSVGSGFSEVQATPRVTAHVGLVSPQGWPDDGHTTHSDEASDFVKTSYLDV